MKNSELTHLMHAVLDNEAAPSAVHELERHLAADPEARAEFEELRRLFDGLAAIPQAFPPEGLVASVMANAFAAIGPRRRCRPTFDFVRCN